ncbi:MAG TPA: glycosyltransferase [Terriglobales bacterium]
MEHSLSRALELVGVVSLATWTYLLLFRGGFWRIHESSTPPVSETPTKARVVVLIPARDEAAFIGKAVTSLLTQEYEGPVDVLVIDDHSSDGTRDEAWRAAKALNASDRLRVVSAGPLPPGWTGKLWALSEGLRHLHDSDAAYFLLSDADITHSPTNISELTALAGSGNLDLVSLMVRLHCESQAERALIPAFLFFFFMLYPPAWISQPQRRTAAAAGGCILIRPPALAEIGGIPAIRSELIDDCALAKNVKKTGARIFLGATAQTRSLRAYGKWSDIEQMISRTAFTQLQYSPTLLVAALLAMAAIFIAPPLLLFAGSLPAWTTGVASWLLMSICFWPAVRFYNLSPFRAFSLPAVALFYAAATVHSALLYWRGQGGLWKGRVQGSARA